MIEVKTDFTLTIYHAVIEVKMIIAATERTVIKSDQKNAIGKSVWLIPAV